MKKSEINKNLSCKTMHYGFLVLQCLSFTVIFCVYSGVRAGNQIGRLDGIVSDGADAQADEPTLAELYAQFKSLFDLEAIEDFIEMKNQTDPDSAKLLLNIDTYMRSENASNIVAAFWNEIELQNVIYYLYSNGLTDIYDCINAIHLKYGYPLISAPTLQRNLAKPHIIESWSNAHAQWESSNIIYEEVPTVVALFQEFVDTLPSNELRIFLEYATKTEAGLALYNRLADTKVRDAYRIVRDLEENKGLREILLASGFEVDTLRKIVEVVMTWEAHTSVGLREINEAPPRKH